MQPDNEVPDADVCLEMHEIEPRLMVMCLDAHNDGRSLPGYAEVGALIGKGEKAGRAIYQNLCQRGLVTGVTGRKPTGLTEAGKMYAANCKGPGALVRVKGLDEAKPAVARRAALVEELADRWGIDAGRMYDLVAKTMINKGRNEVATKEEVAIVMHVMRQYDLDPLMKQLHAFVSQGRLQVSMGYDGWIQQVNRARKIGCMGIQFAEATELVAVPGTSKKVPEWVEATMVWTPEAQRLPTSYRAYFNEWFVPGDQWGTRPYHRLRMKAYCQCAREGLGIGLADEVDRDQFEWAENHEARLADATARRTASVSERLSGAFPGEQDAIMAEDEREPAQVDETDIEPGAGASDDSVAPGGSQGPLDDDLDDLCGGGEE